MKRISCLRSHHPHSGVSELIKRTRELRAEKLPDTPRPFLPLLNQTCEVPNQPSDEVSKNCYPGLVI